MILTGNEIKEQVKKNRICIKPFIEENINPNSYNYRLGDIILEVDDKIIDPKKRISYKEIKLNGDGFILQPKKLYLGCTFEEIGSDFYVTQLIGRSSVGRLGLYLQITAPLGHVGSKHRWTLELKSVQQLKIYPFMKIGQVSFWTMKGFNSLNYTGKYQKYSFPHVSEFFTEF